MRNGERDLLFRRRGWRLRVFLSVVGTPLVGLVEEVAMTKMHKAKTQLT